MIPMEIRFPGGKAVVFTEHLPEWQRQRKVDLLESFSETVMDSLKPSRPPPTHEMFERKSADDLVEHYNDINSKLQIICSREIGLFPAIIAFLQLEPETRAEKPIDWKTQKADFLELLREQNYIFYHLRRLKLFLRSKHGIETPPIYYCTEVI